MPRFTYCPGKHIGVTITLTAFPVNTSGAAPTPTATTEIDLVFEVAFHCTSANKKGDKRDDVTLSLLYVILKAEGATIFAAESTADRTNDTEPLTT